MPHHIKGPEDINLEDVEWTCPLLTLSKGKTAQLAHICRLAARGEAVLQRKHPLRVDAQELSHHAHICFLKAGRECNGAKVGDRFRITYFRDEVQKNFRPRFNYSIVPSVPIDTVLEGSADTLENVLRQGAKCPSAYPIQTCCSVGLAGTLGEDLQDNPPGNKDPFRSTRQGMKLLESGTLV
jgi:hypothetical protein